MLHTTNNPVAGKLVPVAVMVMAAVACTLVVGEIEASAGLLANAGESEEAWVWFGLTGAPASVVAFTKFGPQPTVVSTTGA